jgi:hypothetical protein
MFNFKAPKIPKSRILWTKNGQKVKVTSVDCYWIKGTIKGKEVLWFDTGNFIGSSCPHPKDIDWKTTWDKERENKTPLK